MSNRFARFITRQRRDPLPESTHQMRGRAWWVGLLAALALVAMAPAVTANAATVPGALVAGAIPGSITSSVSVGDAYSCAIKTDGTLTCWGDDSLGQTEKPSGTFTQVTVGAAHACAVATDGSVVCFGGPALQYVNYGQANPPSGTFTQVAAGEFFTCGLQTNGQVTCWGANDFGQRNAPSATFTQISAGGEHACGLETSGVLVCWGDNGYGELSFPSFTSAHASVTAGLDFSCSLSSGGAAACWGDDGAGQTGAPSGSFAQISAGADHTCGMQIGGAAACWGAGAAGDLTPPSGVSFLQVAAGGQHSCGVETSGAVACWGANGAGQSAVPSGSFLQVAAGALHSCGLKIDGTVTCWGDNTHGQLNAPSGTFTQVAASGNYTCGLQASLTVTCWGDNGAGQLNAPSGSFLQISAAASDACALKADGTAVCWGDNTYGQLTVPAGTFTQIAAGGKHTCGLTTGGSLRCWGDNGAGETAAPSLPSIGAQPQDVSVAAGQPFTLSVMATGQPAPTFQWRHDRAPIAGATGNTYTVAAAQQADGGSYDVLVGNAQGIVVSGTATVTISASQTTPSVTWPNPAAITYGTPLGATQLDATANAAGTFAYSADGNPVSANEVLPAGTHTLTVQFTPSDTTTYATPAPVSVSLTVNPAPLSIAANDQSMTYGGSVPSFDAAYTSFVNGENSSVVSGLSCEAMDGNGHSVGSSTPAGTYAVACAGATATNYSISYVAGTLTINPAPLTITADDQNMTYGGALPVFTASYGGFVNGDAVSALTTPPTCNTTATPSSPVGAYPITCSGAADPNYTIGYVNGTLSIVPAPQAIAFTSTPPNPAHVGATYAVAATGGASGSPIIFTAGPSATCTAGGANGATITLVGAGACTVTANQAGNGNYLAAPSAAQTFTVSYPPLYLALAVTSSPSGPVSTGSVVTLNYTLGNHTSTAQTVTGKVTLTYTGSRGSLSLTVPFSLRLAAGQTLSRSASFTITKSFPRGTYTLSVRATDGSGDAASSSASLTVM